MAARNDTAGLTAEGYDYYGYRTRAGARIGAGVAAGILAAILMLAGMIGFSSMMGEGITMPLKAIGAMVYGVEALVVGPSAVAIGALIQFGFAIVLGLIFALTVSRRTHLAAALFAGVVFGIVVWIITDVFVLPMADPIMSARFALMPLGYFIANILLGLGLAMTPAFMRAFSRR
jgi:uncharacterized membrane protein YagU involved in acid resistance